MKTTSIQWADSTINPIMGCTGCPLYPKIETAKKGYVQWLHDQNAVNAKSVIDAIIGKRPLSEVYHLNESLAGQVTARLGRPELARALAKELRRPVRCYAATLHMIRGLNPRNPGKIPNKGYAPIFETVTQFPGRTAEAARWNDLRGIERADSPWKGDLPRMIFISDMGDALSGDVSFEFLHNEIIEVVTSLQGRRHIWLWLSKRPARMRKFDLWLESKGIGWPSNLVPMCSVMDQKMAVGLKLLKQIRSKARGLSIEPLTEPVTLDFKGIDWAIVGGESGPAAGPFKIEWALDLKRQCAESGTAFFLKQLGRHPVRQGIPMSLRDSHGGDWDEWPADLRVRRFPEAFRNL